MSSALNHWFILPKPNPNAAARLFCFHHAGGSAMLFYPWARLLDPSIELLLIELPGHGTRIAEPLFTSIEAIVLSLQGAILPYCDKPYFFLGHSLGGLIAYELAHALQHKNKPLPHALFVSAKRPPQFSNHKVIYHLSDHEFLEGIKTYQGMPSEILNDKSLMNLFLPILRADMKALETYVYPHRSPLACDLFALGGKDDPIVKFEELDAWWIHTSVTFRSAVFPGDHFFIKTQLRAVLDFLTQAIQQALKKTSFRISSR